MPIETVPDTSIRYFLISHDAAGDERTDDVDGLLSARVEEQLAAEPITDVFLMSHGWKGDVPAAREQCNRWIAAMLSCGADIDRAHRRSRGFRPLIIGYHWPSLPWGDEGVAAAAMSFDPSTAPSRDQLVKYYAERIADTPRARAALGDLLDRAAREIAPVRMPQDVAELYLILNEESGLGAEGVAPDSDREAFEPAAAYDRAMEEERVSFGGGTFGGLLAPLRQLSFWKMKARARQVGEGGGAALLRKIQEVQRPEAVRVHLMGHSFGCIVVCGMVRGADGSAPRSRPIDTMLLAQGALSLWSFSRAIPVAGGQAGYFSPLIGRVAGPILTTASVYDTAVGRLYPLAAGVARQVSFAPGQFPKYGAVGAFGARGMAAEDLKMRAIDHSYDFQPGRLYNLEASEIIREGGGLSGAHNDIGRAEVAHAFWAAVLTESAANHPVSFSVPGSTAPSHNTPANPLSTMTDDLLVLNGINGSTGQYLIPPIQLSDVAVIVKDPVVRDAVTDPEYAETLKRLAAILTQPHLGLPWDVRGELVSEAGWGIVFHENEDPAVKEALEPLRRHREGQAPGRVKTLTFKQGDEWRSWLSDNGVAAGTVDPERVPYYLLIVGDPELIPFEFCHQLDIEYAVGRLHFDALEDYARYARSVVEYETGEEVPNSREVVFFSPRHDFDAATQLSADLLVAPLANGKPAVNGVPAVPSPTEKAKFRARLLSGADATKANLTNLFVPEAGKTPAVLFTASHGMGWPAGHERQRSDTGALLCQDWPGFGSVSSDHYFAASDVGDGAQPAGMIAIHFACYGGGTPAEDRFFHEPGKQPPRIADKAFLAALPQRLLAHPAGGALACVAHVERAWGYSITPRAAGPQLQPFQNLLGRLLHGQPLGHAMKDLNERFAVLGAELSTKLEKVSYGRKYPDSELVADWIERNDAEGYLLLGDPAVSLRVPHLV